MLRFAFLAMIISASWAAQDAEVFTLKDGRVIVGNYDPASKKMNMLVDTLGVVGFLVESEQIVSRKPFVPPPPKAVEPESPEPQPIVAAPTPPQDKYVYSEDERRREGEVWDSVAGKTDALKERFKKLNPCSTTMLRAKDRKDFPLRYRCLITLSDPIPDRFRGISHFNWVLTARDEEGKCFAFFLLRRDSEDGKRIEQMLQKEPFAALHAWISRRYGNDEDFDVDRIIADHWNPRDDATKEKAGTVP